MSKLIPTNPTATAQKWFEKGLEEHGTLRGAIQTMKTKALTAGFFFTQAKSALGHGNWLEFIESQTESGLTERTVRRYIGFYADALASVIGAQRKFTDEQLKAYEPTPRELADVKLLEAANHVVIHSSLGFVELCRELALFRKFGEYDAVKRSAAIARDVKAGGQIQLTFDLGIAMAGLRSLSAIDTARMESLPAAKLPELRDKLKEALDKVEARLGELKATMEADVVV